jgi:hypothetical protein
MGINVMTVKELTEYLLKVDPDMEVLVDGYEGDYDPIGHIHQKFVKPHSKPEWYYGKYEEGTGNNCRLVLLLSRN